MKYRSAKKYLNFKKFQLKWNILRHFTSLKQQSAWRKLFSPPPNKSFLCLWDKNFRSKIYRNIQIFAFQVLQEYNSWTSRNGAAQIFFLTPTTIMFLPVSREYVFYNVEWVEVRKMSEAFWAKLYCNEWYFLLFFVGSKTFYQKIWN